MSEPFKKLDIDELKHISSVCLRHQFQKGERIFTEGHPIGDVTYLRKGMIKIQKKIDAGKSVIFQILQAPGYFGLPSVFADNVYHTSAETLMTSEVCFIAKEPFFKVMQTNGEFSLNLMKTNCKSELQYIDHTVTLVRQQVPGRLADAILYFYETMAVDNHFDLPLNRGEMAEFIGVSTKSLARTLAEFKTDGLIKLEGKRITVLRPDLMERLKRLG